MKILKDIIEKEVVDLELCKHSLRITTEEHDERLQLCLDSATTAAENYINSPVRKANYIMSLEFSNLIVLPITPVTITRILLVKNILDVDGEEVLTEDYNIQQNYLQIANPNRYPFVRIEAVAGYDKDTLPDDIKTAIIMRAGAFFQNPTDSIQDKQKTFDVILNQYRNFSI